MAWSLGYTAGDFTRFTHLGQYVTELTNAYHERISAIDSGSLEASYYENRFGNINNHSSNSSSYFMHELFDDINNDLLDGPYVNYTDNGGAWELAFVPGETNFAPPWTEATLLTKTGWASRIDPTTFTAFTHGDRIIDFIRQSYDFLNELVWTKKRMTAITQSAGGFVQLREKEGSSVTNWLTAIADFNADAYNDHNLASQINHHGRRSASNYFIRRRALEDGLEAQDMNADTLTFDFDYYAGFEMESQNLGYIYENNDFVGALEDEYTIIETGASSLGTFIRNTGLLGNNTMTEPADGTVNNWEIKKDGNGFYLHLIAKYDVVGGFVYQ